MANNTTLPKMTYREFVAFMDRYNRDIKRKEKKEAYKSPYKYKKVFNKGKQNES